MPPNQYYLRYTVRRLGDPIKQAQLLLCAQGYDAGQQLLEVARHAYDLERTYHAHKAVAGAFIHPEISQTEKIELAEPSHAQW